MITLRTRPVAFATRWLGKNEADGSFREILDAYNSYADAHGLYHMRDTDPWCAAFIGAVAVVSGLSGSLFVECSCDRMISLYEQAGRFVEDDGFEPRCGDLIFFDWDDDGQGDNRGSADHVGLVTATLGGRIHFIEGNASDSVQRRSVAVNSRHIRGFATPDYGPEERALEDSDREEPELPPMPLPEEEGFLFRGAFLTPELSFGSKGRSVFVLQALLIAQGYGCGPDGADGDFGPNTLAAVQRFQGERYLDFKGLVELNTWKALFMGETA